MVITAIRQQQKDTRRYSIYIDSAYSFSLSQDALLQSGLATGQELDEERLEAHKQLSHDDRLYARALRYAAMRPRSAWEIQTYLDKHHSPAPLTEQITNKLCDLGLLDDQALAASLVRDRQLLRPTSRLGLIKILRQKRIPSDIIEQVTAEVVDENQALKEVIEKKRRLPRFRNDDKLLMQYLARQGFRYDDIKRALGGD